MTTGIVQIEPRHAGAFMVSEAPGRLCLVSNSGARADAGEARSRAMISIPASLDFLPAAAWDIASLQLSLTSAMCDFMQALIPPVPGTIPAHSFAISPLHTFPVTATVCTPSSQAFERSVRCDFMQALIRPSPG